MLTIKLTLRWPGRIVACFALLWAADICGGLVSSAFAQGAPLQSAPAPTVSSMCPRLEAQLALVDRGGGDPAKTDQVKRYEDAQTKQQAELDRVTSQARRMGCDSPGFFSLFNGQSAQCGPVNNQIQQMRSNLDQITSSLQQLRGGSGTADRESQRRSVISALAQNGCGPQYAAMMRNAQQQQSGGLLDNIFANNAPAGTSLIPPDAAGAAGTYRTVCVRSCDGFYFPISFATVPSRFPEDERTCKNLCPAADASLYTYRNPGEDINQAVSINGQSYSSLANAFSYRREFNPTCGCRAVGQSWADALKNIDEKTSAEQQGDIIVTEDRAKKMSQLPSGTKPAAQKKSGIPTATSVTTPAATGGQPPAAEASGDPGNKPIRSVGPTFIPAR